MKNTVSISECAKLSGVSSPTVRYWVEEGFIASIPTPSGYRISKKSYDNFMNNGAKPIVSDIKKINKKSKSQILAERWGI